jgi:hypothetical protein
VAGDDPKPRDLVRHERFRLPRLPWVHG